MNEGQILATQLFTNCIGKKAHNVVLGYGSFVTLDFGEEQKFIEVKTNQGMSGFYRGDWHLWIYMTMWRIDLGGVPIIGSDDTREKIAEELEILEGKKLTNVTINSAAFDVSLFFEDDIKFSLFSSGVVENEQWLLFTPDDKTFVPGPGSNWSYRSSSE